MPAAQHKDPVDISALLGKKKPAAKKAAPAAASASASAGRAARPAASSARPAASLGAKPAAKAKPAAAPLKPSTPAAKAKAGLKDAAPSSPKLVESPAKDVLGDASEEVCPVCKEEFDLDQSVMTITLPGAAAAAKVHPRCQNAYLCAACPKCAQCGQPAIEHAIKATVTDEHGAPLTVILHDACSDAFEAAMEEKRKAQRVKQAKAAVGSAAAAPRATAKKAVRKGTLCAHCKKKNMADAMCEIAGPWGVAVLHDKCVDAFKRANRASGTGAAIKTSTGAKLKCAVCKVAFSCDEVPVFARESLLGVNPQATKMLEVHVECHRKLLERKAEAEA